MSCSKIDFTENDSCCLDLIGRAAVPPAFKYRDLLLKLTIAIKTPTGPISVVSGVAETVLGICYPQEGATAYHLGYLGANDQLINPGKMQQLWQKLTHDLNCLAKF